MQRQTYFAKQDEVTRQWHLVDASDRVLGRLAARIAVLLMGKHRPQFTPHVDTGDYVVVVNAAEVKLTGRKLDQKFHRTYSRYPGGLKSVSYRQLRQQHPQRMIELAVRRMLPKNHLGRAMLKKLKVYPGADHPHQAQNPAPLEL